MDSENEMVDISDLRVPDEFGYYIGYRCWRVVPVDGRLRLGSITQVQQIWEPRETAEAHCLNGRKHETGVPEPSCSCGIYACKAMEDACKHANYAEHFVAIGEIMMWGKLMDCDTGYRSHFAYPKKLWLWPNTPMAEEVWDETARRLSKAYGIPVERMPYAPNAMGSTAGLPSGNVINTGKQGG